MIPSLLMFHLILLPLRQRVFQTGDLPPGAIDEVHCGVVD